MFSCCLEHLGLYTGIRESLLIALCISDADSIPHRNADRFRRVVSIMVLTNSVFILNASVCMRVSLSKTATHFLQAKSDRSSRPIVSPDISDNRSAILSLWPTVENKAFLFL